MATREESPVSGRRGRCFVCSFTFHGRAAKDRIGPNDGIRVQETRWRVQGRKGEADLL